MLRIEDPSTPLRDRVTRREVLTVGGLTALGLGLPTLLRAETGASRPRLAGGSSFGRAKACILLWMGGGPPQHETWDPKPDAPAEVRGEFKPIATPVTGLRVGELMPLVAAQAEKVCVVRAVSTGVNAHSSSGYWVLTGVPHPRGDVEVAGQITAGDWPCVGAVVRHFTPPRKGLPPAVTLPEHIFNNPNDLWPGQNAGFLGRAADPWLVHCDPARPDFDLREVGPPPDVTAVRFDDRRGLLDQVNRHLDGVAGSGAMARYGGHTRQAFDIVADRAARRAFDLTAEPARVRDRYGRHKFGQSCLLARRLVEAGVRLVQVNWPREPGDSSSGNPVWDTHSKNADRLKTALMPPMDRAYSALLEDLGQRGLLAETLVVWVGEFGRTPKINGAGGRDHWGEVFPAVLAGGGVRGGQVIGASDKIGGHPTDGRVRPEDLTATVFHCLGIPPDAEIRDPLGRPLPVSRGEVIGKAV
ncbi:MAG: hypothetical protein JWO38_7511 [Gemmataceae bacterium]|nr:hypothetical protein [Gemmataceae bacterium]